jgi:hypothetical protein
LILLPSAIKKPAAEFAISLMWLSRFSAKFFPCFFIFFFFRRKKKRPKANVDEVVKSLSCRHPGERRGPEQPEKTGFRLPPE